MSGLRDKKGPELRGGKVLPTGAEEKGFLAGAGLGFFFFLRRRGQDGFDMG